MSHLEANLQVLAQRQPELASYLRSLQVEKVEVHPAAGGLPTATYKTPNQRDINLHSRYDPLREARARLGEYSLATADYVILLGFGLGYLMDVLFELENSRTRKYFIVESDAEILRAAFEARDLTTFLSIPALHFAWPVTETDVARQWQAFLDPVHAQQSVYVMHPPSLEINPQFFKGAAKAIQSQTLQTFVDINTLISRAGEFLDNFVRNIRPALDSPGVAHFAGKFRKIPGVLVSAGPSLDKNVHELRHFQDRLLILSTDTALKPLLRAGVEPHFILTGDPAEINYRHIQGAPAKSAYLVAEATTYPASFGEFPGRTIACTYEGSALGNLCKLLDEKGTLRAWGSVSTMVLDFALLLGCDPIIFVGQDLAYSDGKTYCSGVYFIEEYFRDVSDPEDRQRRWDNLRAAAKTVMAEDIFGRPVETTDRLAAYWNWIVKHLALHPHVTFVNATEGGILKENVLVMSLLEALHRYCGRDVPIRQRIDGEYARASKSRTRPIGPLLEQFNKESHEIQRLIAHGKALCESCTGENPEEIRRRLETVTQDIYANTQLRTLIDAFNQMGNISFLRNIEAFKQLQIANASKIQRIYADYFDSVAAAMAKIDDALLKIKKALS